MDYETGLLVALVLWLYSIVISVITLNSTYNRNLRKLGQTLSWTTLRPRPMDADDVNKPIWRTVLKALLLLVVGFVSIFFSWLYVALWVAQLLYYLHKDSGVPERVKEYRWRLKNLDMTRDQLIRELMKVHDIDESQFETYRDDLIEGMRNTGVAP